MKNIKTSLLTLVFLSVSGLEALSMEEDQNNINNTSVTIKVREDITINENVTYNTINIYPILSQNEDVNIIQNCETINELSQKFKYCRNKENGSSSEELIKYLLGRQDRGAWDRLGELLYKN